MGICRQQSKLRMADNVLCFMLRYFGIISHQTYRLLDAIGQLGSAFLSCSNPGPHLCFLQPEDMLGQRYRLGAIAATAEYSCKISGALEESPAHPVG